MTRAKAVALVTIVALFFAGLASWAVYSYVRQETGKVRRGDEPTVVPAPGGLPPGVMPDISRTGSTAISGNMEFRQTGVMSGMVSKGHRAVTVGVNEVAGVAGFIAPRNRVDVVLTTPIPDSPTGETMTRIILQNILVLAAGQLTEEKDGKPLMTPTVTMDLTPDDAEKLVHASHNGSVQLLLRNTTDMERLDTRGVTIRNVMAGGGKPAPARVRPPELPGRPRHTMTVIDGSVRTIKEFVLQ
ncbi:MAG: Flp pilus assembly protein CpaB [Desulfuromonadales bacterium]